MNKVPKIVLIFLLSHTLVFGQLARSRNGMVVSASDLATKVGIEILKEGGNAIDAAVAVGFALAVTYPAAGNIGGGGFLVYYRNDGFSTTIDFREKAPLKAHRDMYLDSLGNPMTNLSQEGVTSVGVPGSVDGLIYAHKKYGRLKFSRVIEPAIKLARDGFKLSYDLARSINSNYENFIKYESSKKIFTKNGEKFSEGDLFVQKDLANTLTLIKKYGRDGFYSGRTAELIVKQIQKLGGYITLEDLKNYHCVERKPVYGEYRGYKIISMGPPSAGGVALIEALNILENLNLEKDDFQSSKHYHYLTETLKRVYFDRAEYLGDSDFVKVPVEKLISKDYAKKLFQQINPNLATKFDDVNTLNAFDNESLETTHYSIIDNEGNAVSVTTTINSSYGSSAVVDGAGFLLNNEMDDFSIKPGVQNQFGLTGKEANAIAPGKRMLSSMTPTIVLKNNKPYLILGSPGGSMIITSVLQVVMNVIDFKMNIFKAVSSPRIHHQLIPEEIYFEDYAINSDVKNKLETIGHSLKKRNMIGWVNAILVDQDEKFYYGMSDPRGYGLAKGY
jgi:gamma-glutamyltranspeptidase/glutathione hydrolase